MSRGQKKDANQKQAATGRRFTTEQKQHALLLVASGVSKRKAAEAIDTTEQSVIRWQKQAQSSGTMPDAPVAVTTQHKGGNNAERSKTKADIEETSTASRSPYSPKDPGQGLSQEETEEILKYKKKHPSMGPAQIRAQLKRFFGWRISIKAIARVLEKHGYERVHRGSRAQGPEPIRFEAPRRCALWQLDYASMRVGADKRHLLLIIDDFSRYAVGHKLCDGPNGQVAVELMQQAMARHGKPESVRTDRGSGFLGAEFTDFLETELIDHIVGHAYHPQGGGKVESVIGTLRRELWEVEYFDDWTVAEQRLGQWMRSYNEQRAHMGIDGLTPADRFFGRADRVLQACNALSRKRNSSLALFSQPGAALEEVSLAASGAPTEVLRLMIVDDQMELRLCGCRVRLGPVEK